MKKRTHAPYRRPQHTGVLGGMWAAHDRRRAAGSNGAPTPSP